MTVGYASCKGCATKCPYMWKDTTVVDDGGVKSMCFRRGTMPAVSPNRTIRLKRRKVTDDLARPGAFPSHARREVLAAWGAVAIPTARENDPLPRVPAGPCCFSFLPRQFENQSTQDSRSTFAAAKSCSVSEVAWTRNLSGVTGRASSRSVTISLWPPPPPVGARRARSRRRAAPPRPKPDVECPPPDGKTPNDER